MTRDEKEVSGVFPDVAIADVGAEEAEDGDAEEPETTIVYLTYFRHIFGT